ncbi:hypothetical protein [Umezawaea sp.]|uniref:hypothetical protein n=1 Tax=Umezawaea sp. TaxID=1955258 RepID=UPI002ED00866
MPVRPPLPVISVGAVAVFTGLAFGLWLGASAEHPRGESGGADPSSSGDPEVRQSGGDLPPMDFEGRVQTTTPRPSKASTTARPSAVAESSAVESSSAEPTPAASSAVGVTPTPEPPTLPSIPEVAASSIVGPPSSSVSIGT